MYDISFTQNRELSRLKFNHRVLEEAHDKRVELLERLKFISIFDTNFEEFFMVRVGSLTDLSNLKKKPIDNKSNMTSDEQIVKILEESKKLYHKKDEVYNEIIDDLRTIGINFYKVSDLGEKDRKYVEYFFDNKIEPILNFQVVDRVHPFPRLPNPSLTVIFSLYPKGKEDFKSSNLGLIQVPDKIKRYVKISDTSFVFIEDIIKEFADRLFENYTVDDKYIISLTRNTDIRYEDDDYDVDIDFRDYMKNKLQKRKKLQPIRLEVDNELDKKSLKTLMSQFGLPEQNIFVTKSLMQAGFLFELTEDLPDQLIKENSYKPFSPQPSIMVDPKKSMIDQINHKDIFLSFPYEEMDPVIRLLEEAAEDPKVFSIKITLYRIAHDSKIAKALIKASENGKDVIVLMELRARFDEDNNIIRSSRLEEAGCQVVYGFDYYKSHSKVCLITRADDKGDINYITQVATGNYNEKTAKLYTDFSFMTSNKEIGIDAKELFDNILIGNLEGEYNHLLVSPKSMQEGLDKLIDEQIEAVKEGKEGYIRLKMNSISDRKLIDKLSFASNQGVKIDMMVRGICCILPAIANHTENLNIYQIVGRFLEHHRIYQFGRGEDSKVYISSADFMTRNIRNRMEVAAPIYDQSIKLRILNFMDIMFSDDVKIRKLLSDGRYIKLENKNNLDAQDYLINEAIKRAKEVEEAKKKNEHNISKVKREDMTRRERAELKKNKNFFQRIIEIFKK